MLQCSILPRVLYILTAVIRKSISSVAIYTIAVVRAKGVDTFSIIHVTVVITLSTFINIYRVLGYWNLIPLSMKILVVSILTITDISISAESIFARAVVTPDSVSALRIFVTSV